VEAETREKKWGNGNRGEYVQGREYREIAIGKKGCKGEQNIRKNRIKTKKSRKRCMKNE